VSDRVSGCAAGFTLVELLVTMALVAIVMALAVPSMQGLLVSQSLKNATFELLADLSFARSQAMTRNDTIVVTPLAAGSWDDGWSVRTSGGTTLKEQKGYAGLTLNGPVAISFAPNGRAVRNDYQVAITASAAKPESYRCLRVAASGRTHIQPGTCPVTP